MQSKEILNKTIQKAKHYIMIGEITKAEDIYRTILKDFTKQAKEVKQEISSLQNFSEKNDQDSSFEKAINQLRQFYNNGEYSVVIKKGQEFIKEYPDSWMIWNILGAANLQLNQNENAAEALNNVIELNPNYEIGFNNLGIALKEQFKFDEAIQAFKKCISLQPDYAIAYNNLGNTLKEQGKLDDAVEAYNKCIVLDPTYAEAYYNKGVVLQDLSLLDQSLAAYQMAFTIKPNFANAQNNIGNILQSQGKVDEALEKFEKAIELKPDHAEAYNNMGMTLQFKDRLEDAIKAYDKAISIRPNYARAHQNLSYALINKGKFQDGLEKYEWRWKTDEFLSQQRNFLHPIWDGKKNLNNKTILLWCEQGIGDTINWSSRINLISSQAKHCILECQEKLVPLLKRSFPEVEVRPENKNSDSLRDDFDYHLPLGSLYKNFVGEIVKNTKIEAFLKPDPARIKFWQKRLKSFGKGPYIGISWKSSNLSPERTPNYFKINDLSKILSIPNIIFVNLQNSDYKDDLNKIKNELGVNVNNFDDLDHLDDLADVAALTKALDMVISNKTTVSLISAGVGTKTKLANWRQSSWNNLLYNPVGPSVDILERNTWETWEKVFNSIEEDVLKLKKVGVSNKQNCCNTN